MFEESAAIVPSTWESMISWFTPSVLFVLLNLMIGTILFTSNSTNHPKNHDQKPQNEPQQAQQQAPKIARSPSVLQRIKSINFYPHRSQETPTTQTKSNQDFPPLDQTLESAATQYVFNHVLEHQETPNPITQIPNPMTHLAFDPSHHQETPNPLTHFTFDESHHQETPNPLTHFTFDQTHLQEIPDSTINFASVQTYYQENPLKNTHFVYAHEDSQILQTPFVFEKSNHQITKETPTQFVFDKTRVKKLPIEEETATQSVFDKTRVKKPFKEEKETTTQIVFDKTHVKKSLIEEETATQLIFDKTNVKKSSKEEEETEELQTMEEVYNQLKERHVVRTTSDTKPASGAIPRRLPEKMKKSASMKSAFSHFEEEKIVEARRPATVRERPKINEEDDGEVDAKADDFINKFKHQLKLQRIDSISRYKEMITRGSDK